MSKSPANFADVPFRLRLGVAGDVAGLDETQLRHEIFGLFDEQSKTLLRDAKRTRLEFNFEPLTYDSLSNVDVLLVEATAKEQAFNLLQQAREQGRPVITVTKSKTPDISVEEGHGLNAHSVIAIERFNAYPVADALRQSYVENFYNGLFAADDGIPEEAKSVVRERLLPYYVRASLIAKVNQKTYRRAGLLVYSFSALAVGAVAIGTLVHSLSIWAFAFELVLLLTILATILRANHKRAHKNWIEARYVAERVRAAIYLTTCGVKTSSVTLPANVGVTGKPDEWMIMVFNEITSRLPNLEDCHGQPSVRFVSFARRQWVGEQIDFHLQNAASAKRMHYWLERVGIALFSAAVAAAALHLVLFAFHVQALEHPLTFAAIFLPAAGAAIGGIRAHREYSRLATRSSNMALSLKALDDVLAKVAQPKDLSSVLIRVEKLSLLELQDWLMLMSVAKLEAAA